LLIDGQAGPNLTIGTRARMDSHFQTEVSRSLGALEAGVKGINERLDKLNGSVARHEKRLGQLETTDAVQAAAEKSEKETNRTWRDALLPIAKVLLALAAGAALGTKGPEIFKALAQ
jgi:hypothetical protein